MDRPQATNHRSALGAKRSGRRIATSLASARSDRAIGVLPQLLAAFAELWVSAEAGGPFVAP
jgi:hypothetical protein